MVYNSRFSDKWKRLAKHYPSVTMHYEKETSGATADAVLSASKHLGRARDPFLVYYGDILTDLDLNAMVKLHRKEKANTTVGFPKGYVPSGAGALNSHSRLLGFRDKPSIPNVCMGVYLFSRSTLEAIETIGKDRLYTSLSSIDKGRHLNPKLLESKRD